MVKRYKAILSALLVVLIVFAVVTVTGVVDINRIVKEKEESTTLGEAPKHSYEDVFSTFAAAGLPLMKTDIENIFYTMNKNGDVAFYKAGGRNIEKIEDVGIFDVTVSCSGQNLPVTIHYIEADGKTLGYGLFTNEQHPEVFLYDYAFFKVTNQFAGYDSKSDLLLLIDVEKDRFYDENKVYSESFYLYESKETTNFLNEDQRIVDLQARLRTDYKMFTDKILHQEEDKILFFSSRFYNDYQYSDEVDIFISGGYGENIDNNRYILDVASLDLWRTGDGVYYFAEKNIEDSETEEVTENEETTVSEENPEHEEHSAAGFSVMLYDGEESKEIISFEGSLKEDFILDDEYLLNIKSGEVYNVLTGKTFKIDYTAFETSFTPDLFEVSEDGKYCLIRGKNNLDKPSLGVLDVKKNEFFTYTDNVFGYVASMQALNDGTVIISLAANETATTYYQLVSAVGSVASTQESVG
ncbi:MAG: hypothetical protein IKL10_11260 [Clostridia bacterium]|nr:hypothetical protein [Clostridia bacterium]